MSDTPTIILFDLGRVLMHIDFDAFPRGLGLTTAEQRKPYDAPLKPVVQLYEEGKITTEEFLDALFEIFERRFSRQRILDSFNDIIVEDNREIVPFVNDVRKKYRIAVLSNTCACHWEKVMRSSSTVSFFPHLFTSFHLGVMKPAPEAYHAVCRALNISPNRVIFIDDLQENVDGAVAVGMKGILFSNVTQLVVDFHRIISDQNT